MGDTQKLNGVGVDPETANGAVSSTVQTPLPVPNFFTTANVAGHGHEEKYEALLKHVRSIQFLPISSGKNAAREPLNEFEQFWLTRECLLRFLRASKWNLSESQKRLEATLIWRREYGVERLTPEHVGPENETGKQYILGYDNNGRPCLYLCPARQNTKVSPRQIQHLVFMLERCIDLMPEGVETLALLVDFAASTKSTNPSAGQGKQVLNILQTHYPERLGRALVIHIPFFVWAFFKIISPFIDPVTKEKLKFNQNLREHVLPEQLDQDFGGDVKFEYNHESYWPAIIDLCARKRKHMFENWKSNGSQVGTSESVLKQEEHFEDAKEFVPAYDGN